MTSISDAAVELLASNRRNYLKDRDHRILAEHRLVQLARAQGMTWAEIGQALGTSAGSARVTHDNRKAARLGEEDES